MDGRRRIAIACQGGGSHTAFTAGALAKILEDVRDRRSCDIVALSGTSGGAVCAFLAWYALLEEHNEQAAIAALRSFWIQDNAAYLRAGDPGSVADVMSNDFLSASNAVRRSFEYAFGVGFSAELNPYRYSDLSDYWRRRLRKAIEKNVRRVDPTAEDIDRSIAARVRRSTRDLRLFVGAVNILNGDFTIFKSHRQGGEKPVFNDDAGSRVGVEAVLASAAIPTLFRATRTGEAVYWDPARPPEGRTCVDDGVYWDGLFSQNPPVRDLTEADPHEIWVIQINPEEICREPARLIEIEDRRNELSGNTSLNQELYFVRRINELVKRVGDWEDDGIVRRVFRIPPPAGDQRRREKKYGTIKVRRIELSMPLDVSSKLDRSHSHIERLMEHGARQAEHFLNVHPSQVAFEAAWEEALRSGDEDGVNAIMGFLVKHPVIEVIPPWSESSRRPSRNGHLLADTPEKVRAVLRLCLANNLILEQSRDYTVREDPPGRRVISCWVLATADSVEGPIKARVEVMLRGGKVERLDFYPLSTGVARELTAQMEKFGGGA